MSQPFSDVVARLAATIEARKGADAATSYTAQLLADPARAAKKLGEEAVETVIAGISQDDAALTAEAADLIYHLLVLLESRNIRLDDVLKVLEGRSGVSGLDEKASRSKGE